VKLTGDVTITGKLTVLPGTVVKCQPKSDDQKEGADANLIELIIDGGELIASGTEEKHIAFTSAAEKPGKGDWYGIRHVKGIVTLQYCDESFAVTGFRAETSAPKKVENCSFKDNSDKGVSLSMPSVLICCSFVGNFIGVHFENDTAVRMDGCEVKGNSKNGILGQGSVRLEKCTITSNGGAAVSVSGGYDSTNIAIITGCSITSNGGAAVNVSGGYDSTNTATVSGCTITSNNGAGVNMEVNSGYSRLKDNITATVSGCTITSNNGAGVSIKSGSGANSTADVSGCTISYNSGAGVSVSDIGDSTETTTVSNCTITSNGRAGVSGGDYASVTDSIITNNNGAGVSLWTVGVKGFTGSAISENRIGVEIRGPGKLEGLTENDIFGNIEYELKNIGTGAIIADDNYWGEPTTTELKNKVANLSMIYDKQDNPNVGPVSISKYHTNPLHSIDSTPPSAVTTLSIYYSIKSDSVTLNWTAPGDDGNVGTAKTYDIRCSKEPITDANWGVATQCQGEPAPKLVGSSETFTVTGLSPNTVYYFAMKTADEVPNWSALSNVASSKTTTVNIPSPPTLVSPADASTVETLTPTMQWQASADATSYGIQIASDSGFSNLLVNQTGITATSYTVPSGKLEDGKTYYWRVNATNATGTSSWTTARSFKVKLQGAALKVVATSPQTAGTPFTVEVKAESVSNLFGLSFQLNYTKTDIIDTATSKVIAEDFLGADVVFLPQVDDAKGLVSVGITRKAGSGGVNGSGVVVKIEFTSKAEINQDEVVDFTLADVTANASDGKPITLILAPSQVTISTGKKPPTETTNVLTVVGTVLDKDSKPVTDALSVEVVNSGRGLSNKAVTGSTGQVGQYSILFFDPNKVVAETGDILVVMVKDEQGNVKGKTEYSLRSEDVKASIVTVDVILRGISTYTLHLRQGINMISVPLKPEQDWRLSNLAQKIGPELTFLIYYDTASGKFVSYLPSFPETAPTNIPVSGGQGYIAWQVQFLFTDISSNIAFQCGYRGRLWLYRHNEGSKNRPGNGKSMGRHVSGSRGRL